MKNEKQMWRKEKGREKEVMFTQMHGLWGERLRAMSFDNNAVDILWLKPCKRSSWHKHNAKWNRFVCLEGTVGIKTDKGHTTVLHPKQMFEVEPGVKHEFQTYRDSCLLLEVAYVKLDEADIDREALGGTLDPNTIEQQIGELED